MKKPMGIRLALCSPRYKFQYPIIPIFILNLKALINYNVSFILIHNYKIFLNFKFSSRIQIIVELF